MTYLLDTNTCIKYINGTSQPVFNRLNQLPEETIYVCSIVKFELRYGALRSGAIQKNLVNQQHFLDRFISFPFDDDAQVYASQIRANLAKSGNPIGPYDLLIAAIALANDVILVMHNVREFSRVANLKIEDWESE
ncbi:MAG: type II toxin-antitoxin system VapC family toxin [Anaerolineae bacterium]|nr:type II toxin-antitoxin system VapC family toxin [Anaerolineae bacterium]